MNDEQFDQVVDHVLAELNSGVSEQAIRQEMHDKGYPAHFTEQVFEEIHVTVPVASQEPVKESTTESIVDAFAHLIAKSRRTQGRIGRVGFLTSLITTWAITMIPALILLVILKVGGREIVNGVVGLGLYIGSIVLIGLYFWTLWLRLTICIRRLHDMDQSGYWSLLSLLGIFDFILYVSLVLFPGKIENNQYGSANSVKSPFRILRFKQDASHSVTEK